MISISNLAGKKVCELRLRWMIRRDLPEILEIENASFEFPWRKKDFFRVMSTNSCGMVIELDDIVVGYIIYQLRRSSIHISKLCIARRWRSRRFGEAMIAWLKNKLDPPLRRRIVIEVPETNLNAQLFFRAMGFRCVAIMRGYYKESDDDAYSMIYFQPSVKAADSDCSGTGKTAAS